MTITYTPATLPHVLDVVCGPFSAYARARINVTVILWHPYGGLCATVSRKDAPLAFCPPGGKLDSRDFNYEGRLPCAKDVFAAAASRELREETGVSLPAGMFSFLWGTSNYGDQTKFTAAMLATPGSLVPFSEIVSLKGEPGTQAMWNIPRVLSCRDAAQMEAQGLPGYGAFPDFFRELFPFIGVRSF